jgi:hypothetical protein
MPSIVSNPVDPGKTRRQRRQLLDMGDHLDQHLHHTVQGQDGALYLAWGGLSTNQVDIEPYPRLSPRSRGGLMGSTGRLDAKNSSALKALNQEFEGYGLQELVDEDGQHMLARANPIGPSAVHRFQVMWLGSRHQWLVSEGSLAWLEGTHEDNFTSTESRITDFPRTFLDGIEGWITLPCMITPEDVEVDESLGTVVGGYRLSPPPTASISSHPSQSPSRRNVTFSGVLHDAGNPLVENHTHTVATLHLPIAWVSPPSRSHRTPQIIPFTTGNLLLNSALWLGALPPLSM